MGELLQDTQIMVEVTQRKIELDSSFPNRILINEKFIWNQFRKFVTETYLIFQNMWPSDTYLLLIYPNDSVMIVTEDFQKAS